MITCRTAPLLTRPRYGVGTARRYLGPRSIPEVVYDDCSRDLGRSGARLVLLMAALFIYRSNLTSDEEDQIFLDDSFEHEKSAQAAILAKVNKVQPIVAGCMWLVGIATLCRDRLLRRRHVQSIQIMLLSPLVADAPGGASQGCRPAHCRSPGPVYSTS